MNKTEAKARIEAAQSAIADAEKELAAAKAALVQAHEESDGRVIMKPSEVPVGEYFRYVNDEYARGLTCLKHNDEGHVTPYEGNGYSRMSDWHDDERVYLTDPYGNAIEPCEKLPDDFSLIHTIKSLVLWPGCLVDAFAWNTTKDGIGYWRAQSRLQQPPPSAAAKLRGMIHKWNQENGGQG